MADAMGFTCILTPKGWVVVDRYSSYLAEDPTVYTEYKDARAEAERLNEKAIEVNRKRD